MELSRERRWNINKRADLTKIHTWRAEFAVAWMFVPSKSAPVVMGTGLGSATTKSDTSRVQIGCSVSIGDRVIRRNTNALKGEFLMKKLTQRESSD